MNQPAWAIIGITPPKASLPPIKARFAAGDAKGGMKLFPGIIIRDRYDPACKQFPLTIA
ncbi:MAG: hypothetical protein HY811_04440 [Planctomycetes bacterium]|nr:hypothetical protein [Planctomycetota bacterium]